MANNINPININPQIVGYTLKKEAKDKSAEAETSTKSAVDKKEVPASDVLSFMAAQSIDVKPAAKKTIDVSKYVTSEQAARIAGFVQGFEKEVEKGLLQFNKEFPQSSLSDSAKLDIVVEMFNNSNF